MSSRRAPSTARAGADSRLGVSEAALLLGVSVPTLRRWDKAGRLRAARHPMSGHRVYARADLDALLRSMAGGAGATSTGAPSWAPPAPSRAAPPATPGGFVGRDAQLTELGALLSAGGLVLTLTGPAGIGKTQLASRLAQIASDELGLPAVFCELAEATTAEAIVGAVADALGVTLDGALGTEARVIRVGAALAALGPALAVLDNLEQVVAPAAALVARWHRDAPALRLVTTSRERLRVRAERTVVVGPLVVPDPGETDPARMARSEAVALFLRRAEAAGATGLSHRAVELAEIARRLEGVPLAIELAAARVATLGLPGLLARLDERLDVLAHAARDAPARHASLRAALDGSWELLEPAGRVALARCSVFRGGFGLDAALAVLAPRTPERDVATLLDSLCDKSLVRRTGGADAPRFDLFVTVRDYAAERLDELALGADTRRRHAAHFARIAGDELGRAPPWAMVPARSMEVERDNLLAAQAYALDHDAAAPVVLALALEHGLASRVPITQLLTRLDGALAAARGTLDPALEARADAARGRLLSERGDLDASAAALRSAVALAERAGETALQEHALGLLGVVQVQLGERSAALTTLEQAQRLGARRERERDRRFTWAHHGSVLHEAGELEGSERAYQRALAIARAIGDDVFAARMGARLGRVAADAGRTAEAQTLLADALAVLAPRRDRYEGWCRAHLASLAARRGALDEARGLYGRAVALFAERGALAVEALHRGLLAAVLADLGREAEAQAAAARARADAVDVGGALLLETLDVLDTHIELLAARVDLEASRRRAAAARIAGVEALVARAEGHADRDKDLRLALALTRRAIAESRRPGAGLPARPALVAGPAGAWFTPPSGERVDLARREPLRRVFAALVEARGRAPGEAVTQAALLSAGWPGERVLARAGAQRVQSAVAELRALGLSALLSGGRAGYRLDPRVPTRLEDADRT